MGARSVAITPTTAYKASMRNNAPNGLVNRIKMIAAHEANRVLSGFLVEDPTTPSSQAAGVGNTVVNVNRSAGLAVVNGVVYYLAKTDDYALHTGSLYTGFANGQSAVITLCLKNVAGTVTLEIVKGAAALTGAQVAPSDATITAQVGAGNTWIKLAEITINRTGDETMTQSIDNGKRPVLGVTVDTSFNITD